MADSASSLDNIFSHQSIKEVVDSIPAALFIKDSNSRFILMNRACEDQWGMPFSDLRGTTGGHAFPPEQMEWFLAKDQAAFAGHKQIDCEEQFWNAKLKENRTGHTIKKPLYDAEGNPLYLIGITIDITDRSRAEANLRESEDKLRGLFELSPLGIALVDMGGHFVEFNEAFREICGYSANELNALDYWALTPKEYEAAEARQLELLESTGQYGPYQKKYIRKDGVPVPLQLNGMLITGKDGQKYIWSIVEDITERKKSEIDLQIAACAFEAQVGIIVTDANGVILKVNRAFTEDTGYTAEEVVGKTPRLLKSDRHDSIFYAAMWENLRAAGVWQGEIWDRRKNGETYPKWMTITAVKNDNGITTHYVSTQADITERKAAEEEIKSLAFYDALTGLPNRRLLLDRVDHALTSFNRSQRQGALLFIDLDHFKTLNDSVGHAVGDLLLQQVAERLNACVREIDTVARLGGDEFVVLLEGLSEDFDEATVQAKIIAEKILATLDKTYVLGSHEHQSSSSIGVTMFGRQPASVMELMKQADSAMYQAKGAGRNTLRFFDANVQATIIAHLALEKDLRKAIHQGQFLLYYQPQADAQGHCLAVEALVRWQHPERGMVSPADFIPLAEATGLILPLGHWVLETACRQLVTWADRPELADLKISVNISALQFRHPNFVTVVTNIIETTGANPQSLKLELTESLLISNVEDIIAKMTALKSIGVRFSLDDFGTGFSSLSYLSRMPLDQLKIDRSFVRNIESCESDAVICAATIKLAHSLRLNVVAEGVETNAQQYFLTTVHRCDLIQGYLYSRPLPVEALEEFVRSSSTLRKVTD